MANSESGAPGLMAIDNYVQLPAIPADHRLCYGPNPAQCSDLYLPLQRVPTRWYCSCTGDVDRYNTT